MKPGDDLSFPYDGMQARDSNGVIYTYNTSLDAWLLPDLEVLSNNGYVMQFDNGLVDNDFDGAILSTVMTIALVEPTPVGEIIVGGVILVIFVYEAYQLSKIKEATRTHCAELFYLCSTKYGYKNMDCATCQRFCNVQGYWDFNNCPLRD